MGEQSIAAGTAPGRWKHKLASLATAIVGIGLPPLCPNCREPLAQARGLCPECWSRLSFISRPYCDRLGVPFPYDQGAGMLSLEAIANPPAYQRARAVVCYDDAASKLVHALKYADRLDLAPMLGAWMARAGAELLDGADALVPVPLHWRRLWARRFNQSTALAKAIGRERGIPVLYDVLKRPRPTPQQVGLTRNERLLNVQGAFRVDRTRRSDIAGRRLILVDDVLTSGATCDACARVLRRAGAGNVDVLVLARVVEPSRSPI